MALLGLAGPLPVLAASQGAGGAGNSSQGSAPGAAQGGPGLPDETERTEEQGSQQAAPANLGSSQGQDLTRDEAKRRLDATKQQLESSKTQEQGLSRNVAELDAERARLNQALIDAGQKVQASEATLTATEQRLKELNDKVQAIQNSITARKRTIVKMLTAMERIGRTPPPAFVTPRKDALAAVRSAMLLAKVFPELKLQADRLSRQLEGLVKLQTGIAQERDAEKAQTAELTAEQKQLDTLLAEKQQQLASSQSQLVAVQQLAAQQAKTVSDLGDLIKRMDAEIAKAQVAQYDAEVAAEQALRARQEQALLGGNNGHVVEIKPQTTKLAFASPARMSPAIPFNQAKGRLPLPVKGSLLTHFGDDDGIGGTRKGISLATRDDARVIAPADGWVVFAGPFRSYGQLLILNTGGGYHVLLAGMSRIDVSVGQFVLTGEPIAEMGEGAASTSSGSSRSRPALYVEFRKDGHPIDPAPWWAGSSNKVQG